MNRFFILTILTFVSINIFSQNIKNDSIPPEINDYSNRKRIDISASNYDYLKTKDNTIVIIDNKIFDFCDDVFKKLDQSKITKMEVIKDEETKNKIKNVIIIITK